VVQKIVAAALDEAEALRRHLLLDLVPAEQRQRPQFRAMLPELEKLCAASLGAPGMEHCLCSVNQQLAVLLHVARASSG
jgi:hypothetical protein